MFDTLPLALVGVEHVRPGCGVGVSMEQLLRKTIFIPILLAIGVFVFAADPPQQEKKTPSKSPSKAASKKRTNSKKAATKNTNWRTAQRTPTPERYKEIQQALADKGYLQPGSPNGVWD